MSAQWIAEIIGEMHIKKVTGRQLAEQLQVTPEYVSMVLNGHRSPEGAEERFRNALRDLLASRSNVSDATTPLVPKKGPCTPLEVFNDT